MPFMVPIFATVLAAQTAPAPAPAPATAPDAPTAPSGKWTADFADTMCTVSRSYGTGQDAFQFGMFAAPDTGNIELVLLYPSDIRRPYGGGGVTIDLGPTGKSEKTSYREYSVAQSRVVRIALGEIKDADLIAADSIHFAFDHKSGSTVPFGTPIPHHAGGDYATRAMVPNMRAAIRMLSICNDDLVRRWGFDPAAIRAATAPKPTSSPGTWVTAMDYPSGIHVGGNSGIVMVHLSIDTAGNVSDCGIILSSGIPAVDTRTCERYRERGHFRPAIGADGKPMPGLWTVRVFWQMD